MDFIGLAGLRGDGWKSLTFSGDEDKLGAMIFATEEHALPAPDSATDSSSTPATAKEKNDGFTYL